MKKWKRRLNTPNNYNKKENSYFIMKNKRISEILKDKETIDGFLRLYKATIQGYTNQWDKINEGRGYNVMIKSDIDTNLMDSAKSMAESMM